MREEILARVAVESGTGCWVWTGSRFSTGYGRIKRKGFTHRAHRLSYEAFVGPIPDGLDVLHRCDNPPCVNPHHLFIGTQVDNAADAVAKGRLATGDRNGARLYPERLTRGSNHHAAKLTVEDVRGIRERYSLGGVRQADLAAEYGVGQTAISKIILRREKWRTT